MRNLYPCAKARQVESLHTRAKLRYVVLSVKFLTRWQATSSAVLVVISSSPRPTRPTDRRSTDEQSNKLRALADTKQRLFTFLRAFSLRLCAFRECTLQMASSMLTLTESNMIRCGARISSLASVSALTGYGSVGERRSANCDAPNGKWPPQYCIE